MLDAKIMLDAKKNRFDILLGVCRFFLPFFSAVYYRKKLPGARCGMVGSHGYGERFLSYLL